MSAREIEIRDFPSVWGGYFAFYPVARSSVTAERLAAASPEVAVEIGFSIDEMDFHDLLYVGVADAMFDPGLRENRERAASIPSRPGEPCAFEWNLYDNFYEVAAMAEMARVAGVAAKSLRSGGLGDAQPVPPLALRGIDAGIYEVENVADFYERFRERALVLASLDSDLYVVDICGP